MLNGRPIGRARSKREAVELALRTLVNLQQQAEIRAFRGRLAWAPPSGFPKRLAATINTHRAQRPPT